jgi:hypothetical protein
VHAAFDHSGVFPILNPADQAAFVTRSYVKPQLAPAQIKAESRLSKRKFEATDTGREEALAYIRQNKFRMTEKDARRHMDALCVSPGQHLRASSYTTPPKDSTVRRSLATGVFDSAEVRIRGDSEPG